MTASTLTHGLSTVSTGQQAFYSDEILKMSDCGSWTLTLPSQLKSHQHELESLLNKVFRGRCSDANLPLAQQLALNWCMSKCKQTGLSFDDFIR